jgi:hypothetical protein
VTENDLDQFADRALTLLTDEDARARAATELRMRVSTFYSRQATLEQMKRLAGVE